VLSLGRSLSLINNTVAGFINLLVEYLNTLFPRMIPKTSKIDIFKYSYIYINGIRIFVYSVLLAFHIK
jgi:hypothetical protein